MRAILLAKAGGVENFKIEEIDQPTIGSDEVLIKTKCISINPVDYKVRGNEHVLSMIYGSARPAIVGWDVAGEVVKLGKNVTKLKIGDRVFGMVNFVGAGNAYAEYVASPQEHLSKIPKDINFEDAVASTLAALTALQVLRGKINKGDRVLIHAGSGGVGHFAIQMAKSMGAFVISTSSSKNKDFILTLGADQHIDYKKEAFEKVLSNIDFVFDMFNGEILHNSVKLVKEGGTVVSIPTPEFTDEVLALAKAKHVNLSFHMVQSSADDMKDIADQLENRTLKPHVSKVFSFEEMGLAHLHLESGRTVGKVVVRL